MNESCGHEGLAKIPTVAEYAPFTEDDAGPCQVRGVEREVEGNGLKLRPLLRDGVESEQIA